MKIAFDEHVPPVLVTVFQTLAAQRQIRRTIGTKKLPKDLLVVRAKDYAPEPLDDDFLSKSDAPWIERFAKDGGKFIISGNTKMLDMPHELRALQDNGTITIFFDSIWIQAGFFEKCALKLKYWELIVVSFTDPIRNREMPHKVGDYSRDWSGIKFSGLISLSNFTQAVGSFREAGGWVVFARARLA